MATVSVAAPMSTGRRRFLIPPWQDDDPRRRELEQRLPDDHLARCIQKAVAQLDLEPLYQAYGDTGSKAFPPELLLQAVLYQTRRGQHSPAAWYRDASECEPVRWLLRNLTPSRTCWYTFRDRLAPLLPEVNRQPLFQAIDAGLTPATRAVLDGTTIAANASRHKLVNEETLHRRLSALEVVSAGEQRQEPPPKLPAWMAPTAVGRAQQYQRLTRAATKLAVLQTRNQAKRKDKRRPASKVVISLSDPDAIAGRDKEGAYRPLYNAQIADDLDSPFVLGYEVFAQQNDASTMKPMLLRLAAMVGHQITVAVADTAYAGGADLAVAAELGVTIYAAVPGDGDGKKNTRPKLIPKREFTWLADAKTYVCPQGHRLVYEYSSREQRSGTERVLSQRYRCPAEHCLACPLQVQCTRAPASGRVVRRSEYEHWIEALRARMATAEAKALYRLRGQTVERINADFKQHRKLRRFSGRGLARVQCQVGLTVLTHNLLTLLTEKKKLADKRELSAA
jgi:transposase